MVGKACTFVETAEEAIDMFAVVETGGSQYKVRVGDEIRVEKLDGDKDQQVTFERVLLWTNNGELKTGSPFVEGGRVKATIVQQAKDKKVIVFRHRRRKGYDRRRGHRQPFTTVRITEIVA